MSLTIRILGLDPGLARMGWGVLALDGTRLTHIAHGVHHERDSKRLPSTVALAYDGLRITARHLENS